MAEIAGRGDPIKTLELLWHGPPAPKRGPKSKTSLSELVAAAIRIADAEGIDAVTTRRVAEAVGISPMSFYTHVPGRAELLDLMLDAIATGGPSSPPAEFKPENWRANVTLIATSLWDFYMQHPWVVDLATHRPVMGPNALKAYEMGLSALDGIGLTDLEIDRTFAVIANYTYGAVRDAAREKLVFQATGLTDYEWWELVLPFVDKIDFSPYPVTSRVGPVAGEHHGAHDPLNAFQFGLDRLLDGIELYLKRKAKT